MIPVYLQHLEITQFRNLQHLSLRPHRKTNFIIGPNGAGKTSILESVSVLSSGRSFRTPDFKKLVTQGHLKTVVFARIAKQDGRVTGVGFSKDLKGGIEARADGLRLNRVSDLAKLVPALSIDTGSVEFIEGGPSVRRAGIDWGLFHVEQPFLDTWYQYRTALRQKLALLRKPGPQDKHQLRYWNKQLVIHGEVLDSMRYQYVTSLADVLKGISNNLDMTNKDISMVYKPGWPKDNWNSFQECLDKKLDVEIERRGCLYGPHRADLDILWGGTLCKDICSRGQKKLVLYAVRLAQVALMIRITDQAPILLLDDLPAEMDTSNLVNIARILENMPCQSFISAIDTESISGPLTDRLKEHAMFHVEHGALK